MLSFNVHDLTFAIDGWAEVVEALRLDFAFYAQSPSGEAVLDVRIERRAPDFSQMPDLAASFVTPRNAVYQDGERTIVDYSARALAVFDRMARVLVIQGEEAHLLHEIAYLFVLSQVGEHLDAHGLTRLHALGLVGGQGAVAVMLPSGGGKSRLALRALKEPGVRLLSDDTPLLDRRGRLHPFPLRIGLDAVAAQTLPQAHVRRIRRLEYPDKHVVSIEAFREQIASGPTPLAHLVIGQRRLGERAKLSPVGRRGAVGPLLREGVVGLGVAQMIEWVLHRGARDALGKTGLATRRTACCAAGLARARVWQIDLGRDPERNWDALAPLLLPALDMGRSLQDAVPS